MIRTAFRTPFLCCATVLALLAMPAMGQEGQEGQETPDASGGAFYDTVEVNVVNVDVVVTDHGEVVTDLTRDDFEVFEDGDPVLVTNFFKVVDGKVLEDEPLQPIERPPAPSPPPASEVAPPPLRPGEAEELPEDQRLHMIVYVDNLNIEPFHRNRVFRRLRQFLRDNLSPGDRVMLVDFNRSFHERVPFTSDPSLINNELFEMEKETAGGVNVASDRRDIEKMITDPDNKNIGDVYPFLRNYAASRYNDMMVTISAVKQLIETLGGLKGRKALIYVCDGLPMVPAEDLYHAVYVTYDYTAALTDVREFDTSRRFQELAAQANTNRVTFYTIDAGGLRTFSNADVERFQPQHSAFVDSVHWHNIQAPLQMLAEETGGKAIINTNDVEEPLARVGRELRTYYSLGFTARHSGDGRYHRVKVKVKRKGLDVRYRTGYRDKPVSSVMNDGTMAALLYGAQDNSMGLRVAFGKAKPAEGGYFLVPIVVQIPLDNITLIPREGVHVARLRLFVSALDSEGGTAPVQEVPVPIQITDENLEQAKGKYWAYEVQLRMRRGDHTVAVGVRDEIAREKAFVSGHVRVAT